MTNEDLIWLAGFVDGEGYVGVVSKGPGRYQAQLRIATTHKPTMEFVARLLGSPLHSYIPKKGNQCKTVYSTCIYDKTAEFIVGALLPYLRTKQEQAKVLLDFRKTVEYGRNQFSPPRSAEQAIFHQQLKVLNRRGAAA